MPKTIQIKCSGYSVYADWYPGKDKGRILLALIGLPSNRKNYGDILSAIVDKTGMSALVFEYSGLGDSPFIFEETRPAQHFLEVIYVFDWLSEKYPDAKISVMGTSYGGYLATQLTKYRNFDRLILRVPAIYTPSDFYSLNGKINSESGWAAKDAYRRNAEELAKHPLLARASSFKGKSLVVVHSKDEQIPPETTNAYIKAFNSDVYVAEGFPHSPADMSRQQIVDYQNHIGEWLLS